MSSLLSALSDKLGLEGKENLFGKIWLQRDFNKAVPIHLLWASLSWLWQKLFTLKWAIAYPCLKSFEDHRAGHLMTLSNKIIHRHPKVQ